MRSLREISNRLAKLESAAGMRGETLVILIRAFTSAGDEPTSIVGPDSSSTWTRSAGESVEELRCRALAEAAGWGVGVYALREVNAGNAARIGRP